jgi:aminobenzoyl-glutamate utilization protein B
MKRQAILFAVFYLFAVLAISKEAQILFLQEKQKAVASVDAHQKDLIHLSDQVWEFAETALRETKSSKVLADYAEQQGFKVERGVAGMPTAFIATFGQGKPIIGILGEFDALPGISQKATSVKEPFKEGAPGHGCGHNLFGAGSLGAAIAMKELIQSGKLKGTIRYYGTPAEEAVGGKVYMVRDGLFKDLDVCLAWHPATETVSDTKSSQAVVDFIVEFKGKAAHAAFDPWNGRSAVDALEIFTHALNLMREHIRPTQRMHYVIQKGGDVPNVVPEYSKLWVWVRDSKTTGLDGLLERMKKIAEGAALAAGVESKFTVQTGDYEMLVNFAGQRILHNNLQWLGPLKYTEEEQKFAREIQKATGVPEKGLNGQIKPFDEHPGDPEGGSTDVGDVSWVVPIIHLSVTTAPVEAPWHAWPVVACGGMSIGHKGLVYAAKALAATMVDLYSDPAQREKVRKEFAENTKGTKYKPYIGEGPPPIPEDTK